MNLHRDILWLAIPSIVSNITVPLLGLVDVTIMGHIGDARFIGAIAVGSMIFNVMYWLFGFLRMGTSGLTAQAYGRENQAETALILRQSLKVALGIGMLIILLQWPLRVLALWLMQPSEEVAQIVTPYYNICVWGAPAVLGLYAMTGWYVGMQNTRIPMMVAIIQNVVNILASLFFVFALHMQAEGVALGTLVAQWAGFALSLKLRVESVEVATLDGKRQRGLHVALDAEEEEWSTSSGSKLYTLHSTLYTFHRQSRHFPPHALPGGCQPLFYVSRSTARHARLGSQHPAHATVYHLQLLHGWLCLCRRGTGRPLLWGWQSEDVAECGVLSLWVGNCDGGAFHAALWSGG